MVGACLACFGRHLYRRNIFSNYNLVPYRCFSKEFIGELEHFQEFKVPETEVNKRLSKYELTYSRPLDHLLFSANQVGVNRPIEDRWNAYQFGSTIYASAMGVPDYGGTVFTVVDGHGGHACAHAVNLLHADYVITGLMPPEVSEQVLMDLRNLAESHAPYSVCEFSDTLWARPEAVLTSESEYIGPPLSKSSVVPKDSSYCWTPWGPWGPLASSVRQVHFQHIRKILEESLSCSFGETDSHFEINEDGHIYDPEGFLVTPRHLFSELINLKATTNQRDSILRTQPNDRLLAAAATESIYSCSGTECFACDDLVSLQDRVAQTCRMLRNHLKRLDLDLSFAAQPSNQGPSLNKALLRIVFSGCVTTSAFIPNNGRELYITQVGDCGAVIGRSIPNESLPNTNYAPENWQAELLIEPHSAENAADVSRLKKCHPVHEADLLLRDDRLLGELMPLRAFGDIRFKWPMSELKNVARLLDLPPNYPIMPSFYTTPPYLDPTPQVVWRPLLPQNDFFLILATDGLWDMLTPLEAVQVVARHWFDYDCNPTLCGPGDTAASRLIRTALGGEEMDPQRISVHFSIPGTVARYYRDDITVIVVYLPTAFPS